MQLLELLILIAAAFVPSLLYLVWIRNTERFTREPYGRLLRVFVFGATVSVALALVWEIILMILLGMNAERVYQLLGENPNLMTILLACVIAPFVEEATKALGVFRVRRIMSELEDGLVYGAAVGLGFAATENLIYEGNAYLADGAGAFIATTIVRSLSSALLHAGATSVMGLGVARAALQGRSSFPHYLGAVTMHALFNLGASLGILYEGDIGEVAYLIGLVVAFVIAISGISMVRAKIRHLERARRYP